MKVEQIKTPDDVERYIEGCLNDFETAISTKDETVVYLAELVVHVYTEAKKKQQSKLTQLQAENEQLKKGKLKDSALMLEKLKAKYPDQSELIQDVIDSAGEIIDHLTKPK